MSMTAAPALPPVSVLVVEDEEPIRSFLATTLAAEGYEVHLAASAREGTVLAGNRRIDLFLIDLGLPDEDGVQLIRRIRGWSQRPILVLSARALEPQKVEALDAGADDYLVKPFGVGELHARLRVALRHAARTTHDGTDRLSIGPLAIDLTARTVQCQGAPVRLTATEWRLLEALARRTDRVVTSRQLLADVWGAAHADQSHYLRIYIRALRQKLEPDPAHPQLLITETGIGYRLVSAPASP